MTLSEMLAAQKQLDLILFIACLVFAVLVTGWLINEWRSLR